MWSITFTDWTVGSHIIDGFHSKNTSFGKLGDMKCIQCTWWSSKIPLKLKVLKWVRTQQLCLLSVPALRMSLFYFIFPSGGYLLLEMNTLFSNIENLGPCLLSAVHSAGDNGNYVYSAVTHTASLNIELQYIWILKSLWHVNVSFYINYHQASSLTIMDFSHLKWVFRLKSLNLQIKVWCTAAVFGGLWQGRFTQ